jgi:hypothetical protein
MLSFKTTLDLNNPDVILEWKDEKGVETLAFACNTFGKDTFFNKENFQPIELYIQLNDFIKTLPINEQRIIYDAYQQIRYTLDNVIGSNSRELVAALKSYVTMISQVLDIDKIYFWINNYTNIRAPIDFKDSYEHDINVNKTAEKTYLKDEYIYLIAYCIALKAFIPLWGEYINLIRKEIGTDFKEYNSFQLLNQTNYINTKPYQKLLTYIHHIMTDDAYSSYNVINTITNEDYGYYIFCLTNVRKLPFIEIKAQQSSEDKLNIITYVYKYIRQKTKPNTNPKNIVRDKKVINSGADENSKISVLEKYKIKTNISLEDIVELEYSVSDPYQIAQSLSSIADLNMLEEALETSKVLLHSKIPDPSIRLLQWVMKPVISPRGILYLSKPTLVNLLAVLQVTLWVRGYKDLALLATCEKTVSDNSISILSTDNKNKIPIELIDKLEVLYPFNKPIRNTKVKDESRYILITINEFTNELTSNVLKMTASDRLIQETYGNTIRRYIVNPDIKITLARLLIEIGSRSWT